MRIVFLDIDGVMNSELLAIARHKKRWLQPRTYYWWIQSKIKWVFNGFKYKHTSLLNYKFPKKFYTFNYKFKRLKEESDPVKWKWLIELCKDTDCRIVISSVWKHHFGSPEDVDGSVNLQEWNKAFLKLGFPDGVFVGVTSDRRSLRGTEIQEWLDANQPIENFVIIDDDSDILPEQMKIFFQVDPYAGLTPNTCYRIERFFNKK